MTRCRDELYLTYPELRLNAGYGEAFQRPSRFLQELPAALYEEWEVNQGMGEYAPRPSVKRNDAESDEPDDNEPW